MLVYVPSHKMQDRSPNGSAQRTSSSYLRGCGGYVVVYLDHLFLFCFSLVALRLRQGDKRIKFLLRIILCFSPEGCKHHKRLCLLFSVRSLVPGTQPGK